MKQNPETIAYEKSWAFFWIIFEWTIGRLFGFWIKRKSIRIAREAMKTKGEDTSELTDAEILKKARTGFGPQRVQEIFEIRTWLFNAGSELMSAFARNAARAPAMDIVYNGLRSFRFNGTIIHPIAGKPDILSNFWLRCPSGQGVRNRGRIIESIYGQYGLGRTLLIAGGSGQPAITALYRLKKEGRVGNTELVITDMSNEALELAKQRASQAGVSDFLTCLQASSMEIKECFRNESPFDTIEICGLFEYLNDYQIVELLKVSLSLLKPEGRLIVSSMHTTREQWCLENWWNWIVNYRYADDMIQLIEEAGGQEVETRTESWGIYSVTIVGHK
jgi:ubiquinone/menaquinone biosynthesis C-methylase UbiE